jgi:Uma2 family endonuclease
MSAVLQQRMTVEEFLAWSEGQEGRYELEDGFVVAMAPVRAVHVRTKTAALLAFTQALRAADLPCTAYVDGLGVPVDHGALFIPDMLVQCGEQPGDDEQVAARPIIVVEVLSPSSVGRDTGLKLLGYFRVPSLQHYLLVDVERRFVVHHQRGVDAILTRICQGGDIVLDPPGVRIAVAAMLPPL